MVPGRRTVRLPARSTAKPSKTGQRLFFATWRLGDAVEMPERRRKSCKQRLPRCSSLARRNRAPINFGERLLGTEVRIGPAQRLRFDHQLVVGAVALGERGSLRQG